VGQDDSDRTGACVLGHVRQRLGDREVDRRGDRHVHLFGQVDAENGVQRRVQRQRPDSVAEAAVGEHRRVDPRTRSRSSVRAREELSFASVTSASAASGLVAKIRSAACRLMPSATRGLGSPREISNGYAGSSLRIRLTALRRTCYSG